MREANMHWRYEDCGLLAPWYTLTCLEWLKTLDTSNWNVFESGAGYSTIWWRANCKNLLTVESDLYWAKAIGGDFKTEGFGLWCRALPDEFAHFLKHWNTIHLMGHPENGHYEDFNCIVIDGIEREKSISYSIPYLKSSGYLIIDNWGQEDFPPDACERTLELLKDWNYKLFPQPTHSNWTTAVFCKP